MKKNILLLFTFALIGLSVKAQNFWSSQTSGTTANLKCIQFLDANNGFAGGGGNGIAVVLKTNNGGNTWSPINIGSDFPVHGIYFINADSGWAVTGDPNNYDSTGTIWFTATGGTTWNSVIWPGSPYANLCVQAVGGSVYVGGTFNTSLTGQDLYRTDDGGSTWFSNPNTIDWIFQYGIHFYNLNVGWAVGNNQTNGLINYTTNQGAAWATQDTSDAFLYGVNFQDNLTGYVVGDHATLLRTTNAGTTWTTITTPLIDDTLYSITLGMFGLYDLAVGSSGSTLWSVDNGNTWVTGPPAPTTNSLYSVTSTQIVNGTQFWACGDSGVIITTSIVEGVPTVNNFQQNISIYPNPSNGIFTVSDSQLSILNFQLIITDVLGNEVYHQPLNNSTQSAINLSNLKNGIYLLEVKSNDDVIDRGKITILK